MLNNGLLDNPATVVDYEERFRKLNPGRLPELTLAEKATRWWRKDPVGFMDKVLGIKLWSKQAEIAESVRDNSRTTVRSASAVGKTTIAACITLWFLCAWRPCTVLTTARSFRQVKEQLWREIRARHAQAKIPIGGEITQTSLTLEDDWFALGFSTDEPERITGFHNKHVLVVVDEACGLSDEVYGAIENPLAAGFTRLLLLGNPTQGIGKFKDSFANPNYSSYHISAFDTPVFTGEGVFPFLISREYIEQKKIEWGEDSPLYEVFILGQFPSGEGDRLISFGSAEQATVRELKVDKDAIVGMGVDTARFGDDENVLYVRKGSKVIDSFIWRKSGTEGTVGHIVGKIREHEPSIVNIDEGYNPGVIDALRAMGFRVNAIAFQGKAREHDRFANTRAEMWWKVAQRFKTGDIQIPNDKTLLKQLTDIKLKDPNRQNLMLIESKEEMRHRGLKSPDRGDALALCFYEDAKREVGILWI